MLCLKYWEWYEVTLLLLLLYFQMKVLCADETEGHMEECLKLALEQGRIKEEGCSIHLAHIIESQRADIHSDPLLNKACGIDDNKFCANKEEGYRKLWTELVIV